MKSYRFSSLVPWGMVLIVTLLVGSCGGDDIANSGIKLAANSTLPANGFTATLSGMQEVPPNTSGATGTGIVMVDPATRLMRAALSTTGINGQVVTIREESPGKTGPIVFSLNEIFTGAGIWTTQVTLTEPQLNALKTGNYSFSVASLSFPEGEIRGQILPQLQTARVNAATAVSPAGVTAPATFITVLTGGQHAPPTASTATAMALSVVDTAVGTSRSSLTAILVTSGITGTEANIQQAVPGMNGPIVFALTPTFFNSGIWITFEKLNSAELAAFKSGNEYFEVRSIAFPNGEIRGQIGPFN